MVLRCWRRNLKPFLCILACVSCLTVGLFYDYITRKRNVIVRMYAPSEDVANSRDCPFNVAVWTKDICRRKFDNLELFPKFPRFPDKKYCAKNISSVVRNGVYKASIKRILVSFSGLEPGFYQIQGKSSLPLRIYLENRRQSSGGNLVLVAKGSTNFHTVFNWSFFLNKNSLLEILLYCPPGDNFLGLDWLVPGSTRFVPIQSRDLVPIHHVVRPQNALREVLPPDRRTLVGFIPRDHVMKGIPVCSSGDVRKWREIHAQNISVYIPSSPLDRFTHEVLGLIMASLQKAAPSKYPAFKIIKLEVTQNSSRTKPRRLLVNLDLTVDGLDYIERFSEYLYAYYHGNQLEFCRPLCYNWSRAVTLSFVFLSDCSRNDHAWGLYFIQNIIELLQRSLEVNFRVIITACNENQLRGYESRLRDSDIDRNAVVLQEGVYNRSRAMNAALSLVDDHNSIVVLCESRVKMPAGIGEEIRKHTFRALMAYSPLPFQLDCGYFPESGKLKGDWCQQCGGVTAMYKEDWEQILSSHENEDFLKEKTRLLGRIEETGIETIQVKLKDLYRV